MEHVFFFFLRDSVSCPFWRLELKSFRRPNREEPNKSVTKGFPCHQRRSDNLKRIPLILTSTSKTLFFNWDPTILFFLFLPSFHPPALIRPGAKKQRHHHHLILLVLVFFAFSWASITEQTVMNLTKPWKRWGRERERVVAVCAFHPLLPQWGPE